MSESKEKDNASLSQDFVLEAFSSFDLAPYQFAVAPTTTSARPSTASRDDTEHYSYLVSFSRPLKTRPVPPVVVHLAVEVQVTADGPQLSGRFEKESTSLDEETLKRVTRGTIERLMSRKERSVADLGLNLVEPFDRDRLPTSYAEEKADPEEEKAAQDMQRLARGRAARKRVEAIKKEKQEEEEEAATAMQRVARGRAARKRVEGIKADKGAAEPAPAPAPAPADSSAGSESKEFDEDEEKAAKDMQRLARGRAARKRVETIKKEKKQEDDAAVAVQRVARGRAARKRVAGLKAGE